MWAVIEPLLATLGGVAVALGLTGAAAFGLFKLVGEKWLTARFDERLAEYRHAQQKELERLRFKINGLMDRATKLHQKEFEALPEAWGKLADANAIVQAIVSPLQQYPDLD